MKIQIYRKDRYGNTDTHVLDEKLAKAVATMTGRKTLQPQHIVAMEDLGFAFEVVAGPVNGGGK